MDPVIPSTPSKRFHLPISKVKLIAVVATLFVAGGFLWFYINQYLQQTKASTDNVQITLIPSKTSVAPGEQFSVQARLVAPAGQRISGGNFIISINSDLADIVPGIVQTPANYFNDVLIEAIQGNNGTTKKYRLALVAKKSDVELNALPSTVLLTFTVKAKTGVKGYLDFTLIKDESQIVGTATNGQFIISADSILSRRIIIGNPPTWTPKPVPPDPTITPGGPTLIPTRTITPTPTVKPLSCSPTQACPAGNVCIASECRPQYCQGITVSHNTILPGQILKITSTAKVNTIKEFTFRFFNMQNPQPTVAPTSNPNNPKQIQYVAGTNYVKTVTTTGTNTAFINIPYGELNKPDLNANGQYPRQVQVRAFFNDGKGGLSAPENACVITFNIAPGPSATPTPSGIVTISPTPSNTPVPTATPTTIPTPISADMTLNLKLTFQGINYQPVEPLNALKVKVTITGGNLASPKVAEGSFSANAEGVWEGTVGFNGIPAGNNYAVAIKGQKHIQRKICELSAGDTEAGLYTCTDYAESFITLKKGENNLDFTKIFQMGGDINQDTLVDASDLGYLTTHLPSTEADKVQAADFNLDGRVDATDYSYPIKGYDLDIRKDQE